MKSQFRLMGLKQGLGFLWKSALHLQPILRFNAGRRRKKPFEGRNVLFEMGIRQAAIILDSEQKHVLGEFILSLPFVLQT